MVGRYLRALVVTLRLSLRGERPPHADLYAWMDRTLALVATAERAAAAARLDAAAVCVRVDGRDDSMALILKTVDYHARTEYRYVLRRPSSRALDMIAASNFNDQYRTERLLRAVSEPGTRQALAALHAHLGALPAQNSRLSGHPEGQ